MIEGGVDEMILTMHYRDEAMMQSRRLQSNGYDCGVWVLACIAALLRGYETIDISEKDVGKFRARLLGLLVERTSEVHSSEGRE